LQLEICVPGVQAVNVGIDELGDVEEVVVRPLPGLLADRGPYSGAVLRGDGTLKAVLDAAVLTAQVWSRLV
jgi:chemotaxis protein histidine kinase CheA